MGRCRGRVSDPSAPLEPDDGFAAFVETWNRLQQQTTPEIHRTMIRWLETEWQSSARELLLLAFRGSGKSTLVGLFAAWRLVRDAATRILVLAADDALARKMVRNVRRIVERHPAAAGLKPAKADQWSSSQFTVVRPVELRDPSMLAKGIGANMTGTRAEIVICDDVEVPNTTATEAKREELRERLGEIDYILVPGGACLYVGTPHTTDSIYAASPLPGDADARPFLDGFARLELPVTDEAGRSRWPERYDGARLERMRRRSGPAKFSAQMMLKPVPKDAATLDPARLVAYDDELVGAEANGAPVLTLAGRRLVAAQCFWDPAFAGPGGDDSVVAAVFADEAGHYWLHRVLYLAHHDGRDDAEDECDGLLGMPEATRQCRQVARFLRDFHLPGVAVESNGIGAFLPSLLRDALRRERVRAAVAAHASTGRKAQRILDALDAPLAAGHLHAHRSVLGGRFVKDMRSWSPRGRSRDDALDAVAGCLLAAPARFPLGPAPPPRPDWRPGAMTQQARTDFPVLG